MSNNHWSWTTASEWALSTEHNNCGCWSLFAILEIRVAITTSYIHDLCSLMLMKFNVGYFILWDWDIIFWTKGAVWIIMSIQETLCVEQRTFSSTTTTCDMHKHDICSKYCIEYCDIQTKLICQNVSDSSWCHIHQALAYAHVMLCVWHTYMHLHLWALLGDEEPNLSRVVLRISAHPGDIPKYHSVIVIDFNMLILAFNLRINAYSKSKKV